ncbi:MAG TPA: Fe-Mn family superoxide dismutase [Polyangiaceae bacterium]|nr:Fe-Mn family superoxide dismutase [Polyangiaceae bacterium]
MKSNISRRKLLDAGASAAGLLLVSCAAPAAAEPKPKAPRAEASPAPRLTLAAAPAEKKLEPLPWPASSLPGLSEKLLVAHHEKNYGGAVKKLNEIRSKLANADPEKSGGYWSEFGTLKGAEAAARNSALLHELYFANLGGAGAAPPAALASALGARFGSLEAMEKQIRGCARATNGWVILAVDRASATIELVQTDGHAGGAWHAESLLVLDMFEHAYAIDYGPNKEPYLDAFFRNVKWAEVARRLDAALARA